MYILTSQLVKLKNDKIPLPWYHRAPLGLMSGTPVHVALQAWNKRPVGDLLVSLVDPANWPFVYEVSASRRDEPGVLADVYKHAPPLNIVFAEAVTVDSGARHDVRLILEPYHPSSNEVEVQAMVDEAINKLEKALEKDEFTKPKKAPLYPTRYELPWMDIGTIEFGWVHVKNWRTEVEQHMNHAEAGSYDLDTAVVSTDTDRRLLRYVFPKKGARSVSVEHADRPGAMGDIASALAGNRLNVLSSLLRRGSAAPGKAQVVFVVEPDDDCTDPVVVDQRAREALYKLPSILRVQVNVSGPEEAMLYPRRPHEIAVRPSPALEPMIRAIRDSLPDKRRPIFISRRFIESTDEYHRKVVEELRDVLEKHGFVHLEALPHPGFDSITSLEVKANMWASEAAIMLVTSAPDRQFSENLAHEWGFMQGQGKPLLPLVQADVADSVTRIANLQGLTLARFTKEQATNQEASDSILGAVHEWLEVLRTSKEDARDTLQETPTAGNDVERIGRGHEWRDLLRTLNPRRTR
jgi:hypothetical protein